YTTASGSQSIAAHEGNYATSTASVGVTDDATTQVDFSLAAGHLVVTPGSVPVTEPIGASKQTAVTYRNDGTAPLQVRLGEQDGGATPLARTQAPAETIKGNFKPGPLLKSVGVAAAPKDTVPAGSAWTPIADYPTPIVDNEVGYDSGTIYSVDGYD